MNLPDSLPEQLLRQACAIAKEAGKIQLGLFRKPALDISTKLSDADIVTIADRRSESVILQAIADAHPEHAILSEESGENASDSPFRWVIDPLDGTTNFAAGLPLFSVSIAIEYMGQAIAGVVYAPYLDEMFTAIRGRGAMLNGAPIHCSDNKILSRAVISTGFPVDKSTNPDNNLDNVSRILPDIRGLRRLGSAAIDISYVGAGFLDGYWELNLHHWDVAAARLIAEEAGARTALFRQGRGLSVVAASPDIFTQILPRLK